MTNWPTLKSSDVTKGLKKAGFELVRQKGSHVRLAHDDGRVTTVPIHTGQDIGKGLFRKILRDVEMTIDEFQKYLQSEKSEEDTEDKKMTSGSMKVLKEPHSAYNALFDGKKWPINYENTYFCELID